MKELIFIAERTITNGFYARAINESIFTEADNIDDLNRNVTEAIECHFDEPIFPDFTLTFANLAE